MKSAIIVTESKDIWLNYKKNKNKTILSWFASLTDLEPAPALVLPQVLMQVEERMPLPSLNIKTPCWGNEGIKGPTDFMLRRLQFQFMLNLTASEEETSAEHGANSSTPFLSKRTQNNEAENCMCAQNIPNPPYVHSSTRKPCPTCAYIPQRRKEMFYSLWFHLTPERKIKDREKIVIICVSSLR